MSTAEATSKPVSLAMEQAQVATRDWRVKAQEVMQRANSLVVNGDEAKAHGADISKACVAAVNALEKARKDKTRPLDEEKQAIMLLFKEPEDILMQAKKVVGDKVTAYDREQQKKRDEEEAERRRIEAQRQKEAEALAEEGTKPEEIAALLTPAPSPAPPVQKIPVRSASGAGYTSRTDWLFEVQVPSLVPRKYLIVDEKAIRRAVAAGVREIKGVRIYSDTHSQLL